jgi:hypothetical protein
LFIDYAGPTVALTDGLRAHIFVSALGASGYTFAYATPRETTADWLGATAQALRFYGGCTELIVPQKFDTFLEKFRFLHPGLLMNSRTYLNFQVQSKRRL